MSTDSPRPFCLEQKAEQGQNTGVLKSTRWFVVLVMGLFLLPAGRLFAADPGSGGEEPVRCPVPDEATLLAEKAVVGQVRIQVGDIFDPEAPGERNKAFKLVNRLHANTRPRVVENLLLFRSGDPYDPRKLSESERLLRAQKFFYDAKVRPVSYCGGAVDVEVAVRDVWTLSVTAAFSRSGGENNTTFEIQDTNLLGTGKDVTIGRRQDFDRTSQVYTYRDRSVAGTHGRLELWYADNSDGNFKVFDLNQPFYSLDTRWAAGLRVRTDDRFDRLFRLGKATDRFRRQQDFIEGFYGFSRGLRNGYAWRWLGGVTYVDDHFLKADEGLPLHKLPRDHKLVYPWVGFDWMQDDYQKVTNFNQLSRTEDLYLGRRLSGRIGYSTKSLGADRNGPVYSLKLEDGANLGKHGLVLANADLSGRASGGVRENVEVNFGLRYFRRTFGQHLFTVQASGTWTDNLDGDRQILLGGDNGLRGYPLRYQEGDRRFLLSLEQRFYTSWHIFKLVHVGAAVFADIGRAWFPDNPKANPGVDRALRDVGLGLRLGSSRSSKGALVHLDVAFPLDGPSSIKSVQWLVTSKESF